MAIYLDIWLSQSRQFHFAACGRSDSAIISSCSFFPVFIIHHLAVLTLPLQSDRKREMGEYTPRERRRTELESSADLSSQTLTMEKARRWGNGGVDASDQFWLIISCSACSVITHSVVVLSFHFFFGPFLLIAKLVTVFAWRRLFFYPQVFTAVLFRAEFSGFLDSHY